MGHSNLPVATNKYDPMYKKCRFELVNESEYHPSRRFIRNDLAEQLVKTFKTPNIKALIRGSTFNVVDVFNTKQQSIAEKIKKIFEVKTSKLSIKFQV